jgi:hypothetical protein
MHELFKHLSIRDWIIGLPIVIKHLSIRDLEYSKATTKANMNHFLSQHSYPSKATSKANMENRIKK